MNAKELVNELHSTYERLDGLDEILYDLAEEDDEELLDGLYNNCLFLPNISIGSVKAMLQIEKGVVESDIIELLRHLSVITESY